MSSTLAISELMFFDKKVKRCLFMNSFVLKF